MPLVHVETLDEYQNVLQANPAVVVDFYAVWCKPCEQMAPVFEKWSNEYPGITFVKVDYDAATDIIDQAGISKLPTFKFFAQGEEKNSLIGTKTDLLVNALNQLTSLSPESTPVPEKPSQQQQQQQPQQQPQQDQKPNVGATGSNKLNLPSTPLALRNFLNRLPDYAVVIFFSQQTAPERVQRINETVGKLILLHPTKVPMQLYVIDPSLDNPDDKILAKEFGAEKVANQPIVKLIYRKVVYATITHGDVDQLVSVFPDFVAL